MSIFDAFFCVCSCTGYAKADVTNLADMDIAQALDEAEAVLVFFLNKSVNISQIL